MAISALHATDDKYDELSLKREVQWLVILLESYLETAGYSRQQVSWWLAEFFSSCISIWLLSVVSQSEGSRYIQLRLKLVPWATGQMQICRSSRLYFFSLFTSSSVFLWNSYMGLEARSFICRSKTKFFWGYSGPRFSNCVPKCPSLLQQIHRGSIGNLHF